MMRVILYELLERLGVAILLFLVITLTVSLASA